LTFALYYIYNVKVGGDKMTVEWELVVAWVVVGGLFLGGIVVCLFGVAMAWWGLCGDLIERRMRVRKGRKVD
jgi:uncharacterized membrane protein YczE